MEVISGYITDLDAYNEITEKWDMNYKSLSKGDFSTDFKIISNDYFSLVREKMTGKTEQTGKTQKDFIVFLISVKGTEFYWFDKIVKCDDLLIFPKENNFEVITYKTCEAYVVSIHKTFFYNAMGKSATERFNKVYTGEPQTLFLSKYFSSRFTILLDYFLNTNLNNPNKNKALINSIVFSLIKYLEKAYQKEIPVAKNKKELAVIKAVEIINNQVNDLYSTTQLCVMTGVSERTLRNGFKEKYKISPMDYIKAIRLNKVKHQIYLNQGRNISDIAGEHHFWHMGQFAKDFKKQFGMLPSETYKRPDLKL